MFQLDEAIGHRGLKGVAPENTLESIQAAKEHSFQWIELDARLTKDEVPVLAHDDIQRLHGKAVLLSELTAKDVARVEFAPNIKIPTLHEALELVCQLNLSLVLELKAAPTREIKLAQAVVAALKQTHLEKLMLVSFSRPTLLAIKELLPNVPLGLNAISLPPDWQQLPAQGFANLHLHYLHLANVDIPALKRAGLGVYVYTVNEPEVKRALLAQGVDGVFTDRPECGGEGRLG